VIQRGRATYPDVLTIPEGTCGAYRIVHRTYPPNHQFNLVTARTAIIGGHRGAPVSYDRPTTWHELHEDGSKWMTDYPIEQAQIDVEIAQLRRGSVLVGGLGLGYVATVLAHRPHITAVEVVEVSSEVLDLVAPHLCSTDPVAKAKLSFVHADLFDHLARLDGRATYDHAYYDTWASDGETTFFSTVLPLLQLSATTVRHTPLCWNESVMRGQLVHSLDSRWRFVQGIRSGVFSAAPGLPDLDALSTSGKSLWTDWSVPFFRWVRRVEPNDRLFCARRDSYAGLYGRPEFRAFWHQLTGEPVEYPAWPRE
jgi:hypothetical protein